MLKGHLDRIEDGLVHGWALDSNNVSLTISVDVFVDGELMGRVVADQHRDDLVREYGSGRHGFAWRVPDTLLDGGSHELGVAFSGENILLEASPKNFAFHPSIRAADAFIQSNLVSVSPKSFDKHHSGIALFAIHEGNGRLKLHQRELLASVAEAGFDTVVINSSDANRQTFAHNARSHANCIITRRDHGRDFASWILAMIELQDVIRSYDHVLWLNDSIYGPYRPLGNLLTMMLASDVACYGLTECWQTSHHLQSYFLLFKREAFQERSLNRFVKSYKFPGEKLDIIDQGEVALGKCLSSSSLSIGCHIAYDRLASKWLESVPARLRSYHALPEAQSGSRIFRDRVIMENRGHVDYALDWITNVSSDIRHLRPLNPTHFFWDTLVTEFGFPFVKRELLTRNPSGVPNIGSFCDVVGSVSDVQHRALMESLRTDGQNIAPPFLVTQPADRVNGTPSLVLLEPPVEARLPVAVKQTQGRRRTLGRRSSNGDYAVELSRDAKHGV